MAHQGNEVKLLLGSKAVFCKVYDHNFAKALIHGSPG